MQAAWETQIYRDTVTIVLAFLFVSGIIVYFLRKSNYYFVVSWASIKSWLFVAPLLFGVFGAPEPWPMIFLLVLAIYGSKVFFQIMGLFHRTYFLLICYLGMVALGFCVWYNRIDFYNLVPMGVLGASCLVPLLRNNYRRMIQYIALTNLCFAFLGWSFMHLGLILQFEKGVYQLMYLLILTEFCDNTNLAISHYVGKTKMFARIDSKRSVEGTVISAFITVALAFGMRHLLPDGSDIYWLTSGLVASIGGFIGDMVMITVRRDAGVRVVNQFVLGRGDFLHRMDRLIFVAPMYYYVMMYLPQIKL